MGDVEELLDPDRYRTIREIGRGGMGVVLEAELLPLGRLVAVKVLHRHLATHPGLVDRLRVEAQALARLRSPYLVPVFDLGTTPAGAPFFVMELLRGRSLRKELAARGALPLSEALSYARQALLGLHQAHALGIIHRDVKLENLFLCDNTDGTRSVKVVDFGVAKVLGPREGGPPLPKFPTEEGATVGTPRYLSPEQARGAPVDARSDVYSIGLALYALVAGRGAFDEHKGMVTLLNAQAVEVPKPPSAVATQPIPPRLDRAILRAVEKEPAARFQSAAEMAAELEGIEASLREPSAAATHAEPRTGSGNPPAFPPPMTTPADEETRTEVGMPTLSLVDVQRAPVRVAPTAPSATSVVFQTQPNHGFLPGTSVAVPVRPAVGVLIAVLLAAVLLVPAAYAVHAYLQQARTGPPDVAPSLQPGPTSPPILPAPSAPPPHVVTPIPEETSRPIPAEPQPKPTRASPARPSPPRSTPPGGGVDPFGKRD